MRDSACYTGTAACVVFGALENNLRILLNRWLILLPFYTFTDSEATRFSIAAMLSFSAVMLLLRMLKALAYWG